MPPLLCSHDPIMCACPRHYVRLPSSLTGLNSNGRRTRCQGWCGTSRSIVDLEVTHHAKRSATRRHDAAPLDAPRRSAKFASRLLVTRSAAPRAQELLQRADVDPSTSQPRRAFKPSSSVHSTVGSLSPNLSNHSVICGISSRHSSGRTSSAAAMSSRVTSSPSRSSESTVAT